MAHWRTVEWQMWCRCGDKRPRHTEEKQRKQKFVINILDVFSLSLWLSDSLPLYLFACLPVCLLAWLVLCPSAAPPSAMRVCSAVPLWRWYNLFARTNNPAIAKCHPRTFLRNAQMAVADVVIILRHYCRYFLLVLPRSHRNEMPEWKWC